MCDLVNLKALDCTNNTYDRYNDELDGFPASLPGDTMALLNLMMAGTASGGTTVCMPFESEGIKLPNEDIIRSERNERKRTAKERLNRIQLSDEQRSLHFVHKQQKEYDVEVKEKLLEMEEWYDDFLTFEGHTPNEQEFANKFQEIKEELKGLDSRINPDLLYKNGPDDVVLCGRILIKNENKWNSWEEQKAVCLMSAYQWLLRRQPKDDEQQTPNTILNKTHLSNSAIGNKDAIAKLLINHLKLNQKGTNININGNNWNKNRLIVATMHVLQHRGTLPVTDETKYAELLAPIIGQPAEGLRKNINHHQQDIKPYGCNLKDLNEDYISNNFPEGGKGISAREYRIHWKGMFDFIDGYIENDEDLAILRRNSAQNSARNLCGD